MKLKEIRISGFRGVPPVDPPDVDLAFGRKDGSVKDVIIFGPNAYGKSSIADALEWFFRERVRGSNYFENYTAQDNAHLLLGKDGRPDKAFIELVIAHNGQEHIVRKVMDVSGSRLETDEQLDGLDAELAKCRDEVIILDHDQFRQFVSDASQDKWTTFSSLIGYEELDYFRGGMDSLTGKSLTDSLNLKHEKDRLEAQKLAWNKRLDALAQSLGLTSVSLDGVETELMGELEVILSSLSRGIPDNLSALTVTFWTGLRTAASPSDTYRQRSQRLEQLTSLHERIPRLDEQTRDGLSKFVTEVNDLASRKDQFDKHLVSDFYKSGLAIMQEGKAAQDQCPFCLSPFEWQELGDSVRSRQSELALAEIQDKSKLVLQRFGSLRNEVDQVLRYVQRTNLPSLIDLGKQIPASDGVQRSLQLATFDERMVQRWQQAVLTLDKALNEQLQRIETEIRELDSDPAEDPGVQLTAKVNQLEEGWKSWLSLTEDEASIESAEGRLRVKHEIVSQLRAVAHSFRDELNDFSSRVVDLINNDVDRYYDALHPDDGVKPFLETQIRGNQRSVQLKCTYQGIPDRDAATLLSESHRNSLGMSVMLAFMKYKRRSGSPIEFLVLDDVTQSFDVGHRLGLLDFLSAKEFPEICDSQIIFLTHDRTLADLVVRPGEQNDSWLRYDIRFWQLGNILIEPNNVDLIERARNHLLAGDDIAAAVYGRHALEFVCRSIVEAANILMPYNPKPWNTKPAVYLERITSSIEDLWDEELNNLPGTPRRGLVDPQLIQVGRLNRNLRLLHFTVHDSNFLDNPPSSQEIKTAIQAVAALRDAFTCPNCRANQMIRFFHTLERDKQGNSPKCRKCNTPLPADSP